MLGLVVISLVSCLIMVGIFEILMSYILYLLHKKKGRDFKNVRYISLEVIESMLSSTIVLRHNRGYGDNTIFQDLDNNTIYVFNSVEMVQIGPNGNCHLICKSFKEYKNITNYLKVE